MLQESELEGDSRREEMCKLLNEKNDLLSEVSLLIQLIILVL